MPRVLVVWPRRAHLEAGSRTYLSLGSVESLFRRAVAGLDLMEPRADLYEDREGWLRELAAAAEPPDVVLDLADALAHVSVWPDVPSVLLALGNMPTGATMLWLHRTRLKTSDMWLVNCEADRRIFERALPGLRPRLGLLPFAVDTELFRPRPETERARVRARLRIPDRAFVLVYAGRLDVQKGLHLAVHMLARLRQSVPEACLVLAGSFVPLSIPALGLTNEGYEERLGLEAERLGVASSLRFPGVLRGEDLAELYAASDVFVCPSTHQNENFGLAAVEAMSSGLPAVVAHWGGLQDTVVDGVTGAHLPTWMTGAGPRVDLEPGHGALARLAADGSLRREMGAAARRRALGEYALERFRGRLVDLLDEATLRPAEAKSGRAFGFHELALRLYLGNLYGIYRRVSGQPRPSRGAFLREEDYPVYRFFQGPYATGDVGQAEGVGWRPSPLARTGEPWALVDDDPSWGGGRRAGPEEWEAFQAALARRALPPGSDQARAGAALAEAGYLIPD